MAKKKINPKVKAGCGVVFVFGLGALFGLVASLVLIFGVFKKADNWQTKESKELVAKHLGNELKLTDEQRPKFQEIINEALDERWQLRRDYVEESHQMVVEKYMPKIAEFLTDDQKKIGREMVKRWRREHAYKIEEMQKAEEASQ